MSGSFGFIIQGKDRVKKIPHSQQGRYMKAFENEIRIYHILDQVHPPLQCVPRFYGISQSQNALQMQKIAPSLRTLQHPTEDFFHDSFACLDRLHQHILHMDLGSSNIGYRQTDHSIVFFDFGSSVTIHDLKHKAGLTDQQITLARENEMVHLRDTLIELFPNDEASIKRAFQPYKKKSSLPVAKRIRWRQELQQKAFKIVFE